jgi:alpha-tubulin suppressor-like RCC1 family protein
VLAVLVVGIGMVLGRCDASPAADNGWSAGAVRVTSGSRTPVSTSGAVSMASATGAATVASSGTVEASIAGAATVASTAAVDPASAVVAVASALEVSGGHRCELRGDGSLWCVGRNAAGQLGDGSSRDAAVPVRVVGPVPVRWVTVSVGGMASCGLRDDGALWCWGDNSFGQLGDGTNSDRNVPVPVSAGAQWLALDVDTHVCAVRTDHTLWCWGSDRQGELGDGLQTDQATPVRVGGEASWAAVSVGPGWTCGVRQEGSRQCWGVGAPAM